MTKRSQSFLGTFALVFAAMAGLFLFDTFLARVERGESQTQGRRLSREGQKLLEEGRGEEAIERFRSALTFERENPDYQLALAHAMLASGKLRDAETVVSDVLERDPVNGSANLTMARILVKQGRLADAGSYYHRTIYGRWPVDAARERFQVRLELVDFLARKGEKEELLAELLPLQAENLDRKTRESVAQLYLVAGSSARAADMFRAILREQPSDADAQAGLGAAEFARENYRVARAHFQAALRLKTGDAEIAKQLSLANEVLALDPTIRGLSTHERYERSVRLLDLAEQSANQCTGSSVAPAVKRRVRAGQESDAAETNLEQAEQVRQARKRECKQGLTEAEQPLDLVLTKIAE